MHIHKQIILFYIYAYLCVYSIIVIMIVRVVIITSYSNNDTTITHVIGDHGPDERARRVDAARARPERRPGQDLRDRVRAEGA